MFNCNLNNLLLKIIIYLKNYFNYLKKNLLLFTCQLCQMTLHILQRTLFEEIRCAAFITVRISTMSLNVMEQRKRGLYL